VPFAAASPIIVWHPVHRLTFPGRRWLVDPAEAHDLNDMSPDLARSI